VGIGWDITLSGSKGSKDRKVRGVIISAQLSRCRKGGSDSGNGGWLGKPTGEKIAERLRKEGRK